MKIIWRISRIHSGFTLVETLLVLFVIVSFTFLPVLSLKNWQEELATQRFFVNFEKMVLVCQQISIVEKRETTITVDPATKRVTFLTEATSGGSGGSFPEDRFQPLLFPETVTTQGSTTVKFGFTGGGTGSPSRLLKVIFKVQKRSKTVTYALQMGSGRFAKTTE